MLEDKTSLESCSCTIIHEDIVENVKKNILDEEVIENLSDMYKLLGDKTRLKILSVLAQSEMCVCDISAVLGINQSTISHQLRTLKQAKLVKNRRDGKVVYYTLIDQCIDHIFDESLICVTRK